MKYQKYLKRDAVKNYFPLPNEIFCLNLSYSEIAVYAYLLYCEDRKTFQCYPSYKTIGNALKMSRNTVSKYVKLLEQKQLISMEPTDVRTLNVAKRKSALYNFADRASSDSILRATVGTCKADKHAEKGWIA